MDIFLSRDSVVHLQQLQVLDAEDSGEPSWKFSACSRVDPFMIIRSQAELGSGTNGKVCSTAPKQVLTFQNPFIRSD